MNDKDIAKHFGSGVTKKRLAELAEMTEEQYDAMRDHEPVVVPAADLDEDNC